MDRRRTRTAVIGAALLVSGLSPAPASAQAADRPKLAIIDFEASPGGWTVPPPRVGEVVAQLLLDRLVSAEQFHVLDGQWLRSRMPSDLRRSDEALLANAREAGVDYVVFGSITQFSMEQRQRRLGGGGFFRRAPFIGGYGRNTSDLSVSLLARIVDVRTGEVAATATGHGTGSRSRINAGTLLSRLPLAGGFSSSASNSRDAQLEQATRLAVDAAAASLIGGARRLTSSR